MVGDFRQQQQVVAAEARGILPLFAFGLYSLDRVTLWRIPLSVSFGPDRGLDAGRAGSRGRVLRLSFDLDMETSPFIG